MNEERMICVKTRETKIKNGVLLPHQKYKWEPIEPAPPKDWRPCCFVGDNICMGMDKQGDYFEKYCPQKINLDNMSTECFDCPFRKLEE